MDSTTSGNAAIPPPSPSPSSVPAAELEEALNAHHTWLVSAGKEGRRLSMRGRDLRGHDLSEHNLREADFRRANLQDVNLNGSRLRGADLVHADLRGAQLAHAELRETDLGGADLTGAQGLLSSQLGGAVLIDTKLPEDVAKFEGLASASEASRSAQGLFTTIILACAYAWLTIASTTDAQLLNNAAPPSARLPILGIDIPLVRFYVAAPILLLCLYIYFHLGLQRLWEELTDLPAIFPDGRPLDKRAAPWLMNSLVCSHFIRLRVKRPQMTRWQALISTVLAWSVVPATLGLLWIRYLRAHDWTVTSLHVALLAGSIGLAAGLRQLASATLYGIERKEFAWNRVYTDARARVAFVTMLLTISLLGISYGSIHGIDTSLAQLNRGVVIPEAGGYARLDIRRWGPNILGFFGYSPFAHLDGVDVSMKPAHWQSTAAEHDAQDIASVKGADLGGRNLRSSKAYNAFFVNAYLKLADLRDSDLRESDLRGADLREAALDRANLRGADLSKADMRWISGEGTKLREAKISGAQLDEAFLKDADLRDAIGCPTIDKKVTSLEGVNLEGANLSGANLTRANLKGALLLNAILVQTDLRGANLTNVIGLTPAQLTTAQIDATTILPTSVQRLASSRISH